MEQQAACSSYRGRKGGDLKLPSACFVCAGLSPLKHDVCRFKGFRLLNSGETVEATDFVAEDGTVPVDVDYPVFYDVPKLSVVEDVQYALALELRPLLVDICQHENLPGLLRRKIELGYRVTCDACHICILSSSHICTTCGFELCVHCQKDEAQVKSIRCTMQGDHSFRPSLQFSAGLAQSILDDVNGVLETPRTSAAAPAPHTNESLALEVLAQKARKTPYIRRTQDQVFHALWSRNIPLVVRGLEDQLQGDWSPNAFVRTHGYEKVTMLKQFQTKIQTQKVTVKEFFENFMQTDEVRGIPVKLRDWPPSKAFSQYFPEYFNAFTHILPMPVYTRHDGFLNLAAHYPPGPAFKSGRPDMGPKAYLATRDLYSTGSTPLHKDITSAVNIMVYSSPSLEAPSDDNDGAEWLIFLAEDTQKLCEYAKEHFEWARDVDPIHAQKIFITSTMIQELAVRGVRPFIIRQRVGEAVFIPAGCPHQVSNRSSCIKIAVDFLCLESVSASRLVTQELRAYANTDLLQLDYLLWYSWRSVSMQVNKLREMNADNVAEKLLRNRKRRATVSARDDHARRKHSRRDGIANYHCPHPKCSQSKRGYMTSLDLINHLRDIHHISLTQDGWQECKQADPDEFSTLFWKVSCGW
ncbi:hypothetical protein C8Q74DRAFT_1305164 [Fomes fomentarius]|nr:hypothetical protein C8Q74DRAFT_1305164 [Fomes fomentarius]